MACLAIFAFPSPYLAKATELPPAEDAERLPTLLRSLGRGPCGCTCEEGGWQHSFGRGFLT